MPTSFEFTTAGRIVFGAGVVARVGELTREYGRRVLLVDMDPQGALSAGLGVPHYELEQTIHNLLVEPRVSIDDVLLHTRVPHMDLVPSNIDLSAAEIQLVNEVGREQTLARALYPVLDRYDYILIDCQPSLGLLTVNGLACADGVVLPTECEFFSLRGLALLTDTVDKVRDRLNPKLEISGILLTRYDPRTVNAREVMARVVERFGDLVFDTVITRMNGKCPFRSHVNVKISFRYSAIEWSSIARRMPHRTAAIISVRVTNSAVNMWMIRPISSVTPNPLTSSLPK